MRHESQKGRAEPRGGSFAFEIFSLLCYYASFVTDRNPCSVAGGLQGVPKLPIILEAARAASYNVHTLTAAWPVCARRRLFGMTHAEDQEEQATC
jgi:hypothetical protein